MNRLKLETQASISAAIEHIIVHQAAGHSHIQCPIDQSVNPLEFLSEIQDQAIVYWSDRHDQEFIAAWGLAEWFQGPLALSRAQAFAQERTVRLFGCLAFDKSQTDNHMFWLPEWMLIKKGGIQVLHWNPPNETKPSFHPEQSMAKVLQLPTKKRWVSSISALSEDFNSGELTKVVFAQQNILERPADLGPIESLSRLTQTKDQTFDFCFAPHPDYAFIGRSPERLIELTDGCIRTEALAGTRPRGKNPTEDRELEQELFHSIKERMEHQIVVDAICKSIRPYVENIQKTEHPSILKLSQVQHLHTPIEATLRKDIKLSEVIDALHPTPAVCGTPRSKAMDIIQSTEDFQRGWYAGLVGWVDADKAEFAVGIRSALYTKSQICFWAGAGIVAQSDPLSEWKEIETKSKQFLDLVNQ